MIHKESYGNTDLLELKIHIQYKTIVCVVNLEKTYTMTYIVGSSYMGSYPPPL